MMEACLVSIGLLHGLGMVICDHAEHEVLLIFRFAAMDMKPETRK